MSATAAEKAEYHLLYRNKQREPVTLSVLRALWTSGDLPDDAQVFAPGAPDWEPLDPFMWRLRDKYAAAGLEEEFATPPAKAPAAERAETPRKEAVEKPREVPAPELRKIAPYERPGLATITSTVAGFALALGVIVLVFSAIAESAESRTLLLFAGPALISLGLTCYVVGEWTDHLAETAHNTELAVEQQRACAYYLRYLAEHLPQK